MVFEDQMGVSSGNLFGSQTLASMGLGVADNVYLRLWNGFATGGLGGIPVSSATAGGLAYYDTPVVNINTLPAFGLMFQYDVGPVATTSNSVHASGTWVLPVVAPSCDITAPAPGSAISNVALVAFTGNAPTGNPLNYSFEYSLDGGSNFMTATDSGGGTVSGNPTFTPVPGGPQTWAWNTHAEIRTDETGVVFRVTASDSVTGSNSQCIATWDVLNQATCTIAAPLDGSPVPTSTTLISITTVQPSPNGLNLAFEYSTNGINYMTATDSGGGGITGNPAFGILPGTHNWSWDVPFDLAPGTQKAWFRVTITDSFFGGGESQCEVMFGVNAIAVTNTSPLHADVDVSIGSPITIEFDTPIDTNTVTTNTFLVHGQQFGIYPGTFSFPTPTSVVFDPDVDFLEGESIDVTLTDGITGTNAFPLLNGHHFEFEVEALGCTTLQFTDSGQPFGISFSRGVELGDVDGDGDLDAFVANFSGQPNLVWLNNGSGTFTNSGQSLGSSRSEGVELGDVDGDGDLDAFVANSNNQANRVWLNNGSGIFTNSGQTLGTSSSEDVQLGDVDGDGDLDAFVANSSGEANRVWLNKRFGDLHQ